MGWLFLLAVGAVIILFTVVTYLHDRYCILQPVERAVGLIKRQDPMGALPILERTAQVRPWTSPAALGGVYLPLGTIYAWQGQHHRAIEQYQTLLRLIELHRKPQQLALVAAQAWAQLAKSYDAIGDAEKAAEMRRQALAFYGEDQTDPNRFFFTRGHSLKAVWRHREAAASFAFALALDWEGSPASRQEVCLEAALQSHECGRTEDTLCFAREGIALGLTLKHTRGCASMAGIAARLLRRPDESLAYHRQAYDLAMAQNDLTKAIRSLVLMASITSDAGHIEEGMAQLWEAGSRSDDPGAQSAVLGGQFECLMKLGRFDEARAVMQQLQALEAQHSTDPSGKIRAVRMYMLARLEAMAGNLDQARIALEQAQAVLSRHEKMGLWCRHLAAWVHALAGETEQARAEIDTLEAILPTLEDDWETYPSCYSELGRACYHLGAYDRAIALLQRFPEEQEFPINRPPRWYYLGECYRRLDNLAAAREMYAKAAGVGFETYYTRLAAERLNEQ